MDQNVDGGECQNEWRRISAKKVSSLGKKVAFSEEIVEAGNGGPAS